MLIFWVYSEFLSCKSELHAK